MKGKRTNWHHFKDASEKGLYGDYATYMSGCSFNIMKASSKHGFLASSQKIGV
jgi:hypothetical protein